MQTESKAHRIDSNERGCYRFFAYVLLLSLPLAIGGSLGWLAILDALDKAIGPMDEGTAYLVGLAWLIFTGMLLIVSGLLGVVGMAMSVWKRGVIRDKGSIALSILDALIIVIVLAWFAQIQISQRQQSLADSAARATAYDNEMLALEGDAMAALNSASQWPVVSMGAFALETNEWPIGHTVTQGGLEVNRTISDGKYRWEIGLGGIGHPDPLGATLQEAAPTDFIVSVDAKPITQNRNFDYGLVFSTDSTFDYQFSPGNKDMVPRISPGESDRISSPKFLDRKGAFRAQASRADNPIRLSAVARGQHLYFFINDQFFGYGEKKSPSPWHLGLYAGFAGLLERERLGEKATIEFSNFVVRTPSLTGSAK